MMLLSSILYGNRWKIRYENHYITVFNSGLSEFPWQKTTIALNVML
jgi:hypothetical protein